MEYKCPECGSICITAAATFFAASAGKQLPPELLFTPEEKERLDRQLAEDRKRRQKEADGDRDSVGPYRMLCVFSYNSRTP